MNPVRKALIAGAMVATTLGGGAIGATLVGTANAQTPSTTTPATSTQDAPDAGHGGGGPHQANGITETELTGDTAAKVKAAVEANQPGATIERMETDAEGAKYEAHITKADGSDATVKLDASFKVTGVEDGHR